MVLTKRTASSYICSLWSALWVLTPLATAATPALAETLSVFPDEYVVTVRSPKAGGVGSLSASPRFSSRVAAVREVINGRTLRVVAPSPRGAASALSARSADGSVVYDPKRDRCKEIMAEGQTDSCSPNFRLKALETIPNDPGSSDLWGMTSAEGISAPRAWDLSTGSNSIVVAVIDTGVDYSHPDLAANMWHNPGEVPGNGVDDDLNGYVDDVYGVNTITGAAQPGNPMDDHYHGTHVAGTIGAVGNNGIGVVGVSPHVKIMALKFLSASGSGSLAGAIKAIDYATMMRINYGINVRLSNNSWGGGGYSTPLEQAISRAKAAGIIFVAAAGNDGADSDASPMYPAGYDVDNIVAVAAINRDQNLASFSNYGATSVDIAAPGVSIYSTSPNSGYQSLSGTSMATPHVAGALALLLGYQPSLSYLQAIDRVYLSGLNRTSLVDSLSGVPLVRTQRALNVGRMLYGEVEPIPTLPPILQPCGYDFTNTNLLAGGEVDTAADNAPIVNQTDEGSFWQVNLPFSFPFFRDSFSTIWLSPNGLVYTHVPTTVDYQPGSRAPKGSIAALQTDLTPRVSDQGVRVAVGSDRVTVMWRSEHYNYPGQGVITARLTIFANGDIRSSVHFGADGSATALKNTILGNPFSSPTTAAKALVGLTGASPNFSSTVNLAAAQQALIPSSSSPLALGVSMASNCGASSPPPESGGDPEPSPTPDPDPPPEQTPDPSPIPEVASMAISKGGRATGETPISVSMRGTGTGTVSVAVEINDTLCQQTFSASLVSGRGRFLARVPNGVRKLTLTSPPATASSRFRVEPVRSRRPALPQLCRQFARSVKLPL